MFKRMLGVGVLAASVVAGLSACDVNQINWANHFYVVSSACAPSPMTAGGVTLSNGSGTIGTPLTPSATRVVLGKTFYADFTHDGVQDVAVLLNCYGTPGTTSVLGTEIQIFTRDGKPVARLVPPVKYPDAKLAPFFPYGDTWVNGGTLYTGVESYPAGPTDLASMYDVYGWVWNGHGFTPKNYYTDAQLDSALLRLPAGWVAEAPASTPHSTSILNTWCLMPHSAPRPTSIDAPSCTIAFSSVPTGTATPAMSVDTPGGLLSNPEYCDPAHPQTVSLLGYQDSTLGGRPASYRDWLYTCADGTKWPVEQYVADYVHGYVLYSSHATPTVQNAIREITTFSELPAATSPLRLSDLGYVRSMTAIAGGQRITLDRVVRAPDGTLINDSPQTYSYDVPTAAIPKGQSIHVGGLVQLNTNGTAVTRVQPTA